MPLEEVVYAQNWEDPCLELSALAIRPGDRVLAICSGGCTALTLLGEEPASLDVVDRSRAQLQVFSLKRAAIERLESDEAVKFLGGEPMGDRSAAFAFVAESLSDTETAFWERRPDAITHGVLQSGRVDRALGWLRWMLQRFVHGPKTIETFLGIEDLAAQRHFYDEVWNTARWRTLFHLLDKKLLELVLGRRAYRHVHPGSWGQKLFRNAERCMRELPVSRNYFLAQLLLGRYLGVDYPPYLIPQRLERIRRAGTCVRLHQADIQSHLRAAPDDAFDKLYLSNVDEWMSEAERAELFREVVRVARPGAVVCFRALMAPRPLPPSAWPLEVDHRRSRDLSATERAFMNAAFTTAWVRK